MNDRDRMDNLHRAFRLRGLVDLFDELGREFEAAKIPLLSDLEDTKRRILALADRIEARQ